MLLHRIQVIAQGMIMMSKRHLAAIMMQVLSEVFHSCNQIVEKPQNLLLVTLLCDLSIVSFMLRHAGLQSCIAGCKVPADHCMSSMPSSVGPKVGKLVRDQ